MNRNNHRRNLAIFLALLNIFLTGCSKKDKTNQNTLSAPSITTSDKKAYYKSNAVLMEYQFDNLRITNCGHVLKSSTLTLLNVDDNKALEIAGINPPAIPIWPFYGGLETLKYNLDQINKKGGEIEYSKLALIIQNLLDSKYRLSYDEKCLFKYEKSKIIYNNCYCNFCIIKPFFIDNQNFYVRLDIEDSKKNILHTSYIQVKEDTFKKDIFEIIPDNNSVITLEQIFQILDVSYSNINDQKTINY